MNEQDQSSSSPLLRELTRRVLILAPHTDDAELGCGGTMARLQEDGAELGVVAFSSAVDSLPTGSRPSRLEDEFRSSMTRVYGLSETQFDVLDFRVRRFSERRQDVLDVMIGLRDRMRPTLVMVPSALDVHQDHIVIHEEAARAFAKTSVICYELPWNQRTSIHTFYVGLHQTHIDTKVEALQQYTSQIELQRPYLSADVIRSWAKVRGVAVGVPLAEVFETHRLILR